ncbi:hypothetical protein BsIDN1_23190 [Bacillus safensis]|uniref:ABC transporter domain-containing protein n=1 Tax=Bacillus safensis TaxID=561879 RepID=A0A5S9M6Y1_BACIA|nr:hypothetical protein BsIDN1_23190 [Bacillus safensis]
MKKVLQIIDLHVSFRTYGGSVQAVRGVNVDVYEKETLAIVGESGCGKSVTSQSIMRLSACIQRASRSGRNLVSRPQLAVII